MPDYIIGPGSGHSSTVIAMEYWGRFATHPGCLPARRPREAGIDGRQLPHQFLFVPRRPGVAHHDRSRFARAVQEHDPYPQAQEFYAVVREVHRVPRTQAE